MRSEQEMMALILDTAAADERIRAVYMNGSRTNPNAPKDILQDYDVVYVVTETASFLSDPHWIDRFGARAVMLEPDKMDVIAGKTMDFARSYAYLMQFADGNRIDLSLQTVQAALEEFGTDGLTVKLLDKDGLLPAAPAPSDAEYHIQRPTQEQFLRCCNEFWWVSPYVAKGLWRREILYALGHMDQCVRPELVAMLTWQAGVLTGFEESAGKCGKRLERLLPPDVWRRLLACYPTGDYDSAWMALFEMTSLFEESAQFVADRLGLAYDREEGEKALAHLQRVAALPTGAKSF